MLTKRSYPLMTHAEWAYLMVFLIASQSLVGWFLDMPLLASWLPDKVTMKPTTALTLILVTAGMWVPPHENKMDLFRTIIVLIAALVIGNQLISSLIGVEAALDSPRDLSPKTVIPGRPSVVSMFAGLFCITACINPKTKPTMMFLCFLVGSVCILWGYALNHHWALYYSPDKSSAMAINTALCFVLLGLTPTLEGRQKKEVPRGYT